MTAYKMYADYREGGKKQMMGKKTKKKAAKNEDDSEISEEKSDKIVLIGGITYLCGSLALTIALIVYIAQS